MIRTILAIFGYVKIPKEAIYLSIQQEIFFEKLIGVTQRDSFKFHLEAQKILTKFLRSGRLISYKEK